MSVTDTTSMPSGASGFFTTGLAESDPDIAEAIAKELGRQQHEIELIASENIVSQAVLEAQGSIMTNKYAEGYPGRRYYGGCEFVDIAEDLAIDRAKRLFGCDFVNVQPNSGSQANQAAFMAMMEMISFRVASVMTLSMVVKVRTSSSAAPETTSSMGAVATMC